MPHRWVDLDRDPLAPLLDTESLSTERLPLALFPDGTARGTRGRVRRGVEDWLRCDAGGDLMTGSDLHAEADRSWWPLARDPLFLESSQPGLLIAGDVRHGSIKRVASAVGEGAPSISLVHSYLRTLDRDRP